MVQVEDLMPAVGLVLCVLLSVLDIIRERQVPVWTFTTWGVLFGLLIRSVGLPLGFVGLPAAIIALIWLVRREHKIDLPPLVLILPCVMVLLGMLVVPHFGPWVLFGDGIMLSVIAIGLLLAGRAGLSAGLFVAAAGFILWKEIFDLTYGLWKTPWGIIMVAILALFILIVSPTWVLRARSSRGQTWGLLLPSAIALTVVAVINAVVRTDPTILEHIVNFRAMFPGDRFIYGISGGSHGRENLALLLFRDCLTAAQLTIGMALTVVLYRWIEGRGQTASDNVTTLSQRMTG
jgi:hypothetical protein